MTLKAEIERWPRTPDSAAESVAVKVAPLWWQTAGLSYTASGYGRRIPTRYLIRFGNRWRRVYMCQFANAGTAYIGPADAWQAVVDVWESAS